MFQQNWPAAQVCRTHFAQPQRPARLESRTGASQTHHASEEVARAFPDELNWHLHLDKPSYLAKCERRALLDHGRRVLCLARVGRGQDPAGPAQAGARVLLDQRRLGPGLCPARAGHGASVLSNEKRCVPRPCLAMAPLGQVHGAWQLALPCSCGVSSQLGQLAYMWVF